MEYIIPIYALGDQSMTKIRSRTRRKEPTVSRAAYEKMAADYDAVVADYDAVVADYKKLAAKHEAAVADYEAAVAKFNALAAEHGEMSAKYAKAQDVIGALAGLLRRGEARGGAGGGHVDEIERLMDAMVAAQNGRGVRGDGRHLVWFRSALLDEYIQDDKLLHDLTLLEPIMFEYIAYRVEEYIEAHGGRLYYKLKTRRSDPGNRSKLNPRYIVFTSFFAKRTNAPPAVIGALFGMHRTTARRQLEFMDGVLENVLPGAATMRKRLAAVKDSAEFIEFTGGELMHDGTLTRAPDSTDTDNAETSGYSGKHREPGFNTLLACTGRGHIVSAATAPGNRHDFYIMRKNPLDLGLWHMNGEPLNDESAKVMKELRNLCDKGFVGMAKRFPHIRADVQHRGRNIKSPAEIKAAYESGDVAAISSALGLTPQQYRENREISSRRSLVERTIGSLKRWKVLDGPFQGTASELNRQFEVLSGVVNLGIDWPEIERNEAPLLKKLAERRAAYTKKR